MAAVPLILTVLAWVCFGIQGFKLVPEPERFHWGWLGLFLLASVQLFYGGVALFK
jgi:hypothetical protein